jgi:hypothetical protein
MFSIAKDLRFFLFVGDSCHNAGMQQVSFMYKGGSSRSRLFAGIFYFKKQSEGSV